MASYEITGFSIQQNLCYSKFVCPYNLKAILQWKGFSAKYQEVQTVQTIFKLLLQKIFLSDGNFESWNKEFTKIQ